MADVRPKKRGWLLAAVVMTGLLSAFAVMFASPVVLLLPLLLVGAPILTISLIAAVALMVVLLWNKRRKPED